MKKVLLLFALSGGILFSACKKDDPTPPPAPACQLQKITRPDNTYTVITRNGSGKYVTVKNYPPVGSYSSYSQYDYSGDMVSKIAAFNGSNQLQYYMTFEKASYGILAHYFIPAGGIFVEQGQFEYHMSGSRITQVVTKADNGGSFVPVMQSDYTFNGSGDVTQEVDHDLQNQSTTTTTYTYDAKKSPYAGDFNPDPAYQSANNILSMTSDGSTETYTYTYTDKDYAATRSTVGNGKSTITFAYTGCN
jgi:hypothetical protein